MARLLIIIVLLGVCYIGYTWGTVHTENSLYDERIEVQKGKEEIEWWKSQTAEILKQAEDWKRKYEDMQCKYNKERNKVSELEQNFEAYVRGNKGEPKFRTIAEKNEEEIINWFNEGLCDREIAEKIGCGKSTIQRAVKKLGLR